MNNRALMHRLIGLGLAALTVLLLLGAARMARACIPLPDASGLTDMEARRAVIWLHQSTFEIIFQNRYTGSAKDFAWVIPLPGVPTKVDQPSASFLEDLDGLTAPIIEKRSCTVSCSRGMKDAGMLNSVDALPPEVTIWGSGQLGNLEYQVLSSTSSQALIDWLDSHGFKLPTGLSSLISSYLSQGFTFFAAKIANATTSKAAAVPAVRFTFDRAKTPAVYPMRISAFGRMSLLDTLIWVIGDDGTYLPKNYPVERMSGSEYSEGSYATALDQTMAKQAGRTFALQFAGRINDDYQRMMISYQWGQSGTPEIDALRVADAPRVVRLRARLNPNGMTEDLLLERTTTPDALRGWYTTPCPNGVLHESCGDSGAYVVGADGGITPLASDGGQETGLADRGGGCQLAPARTAPPAWPLALPLLALLLQRRRASRQTALHRRAAARDPMRR